MQVLPSIIKYQYSLFRCSKVLSGIVGIVRYRKGSKKHLDNLVANGNFPVLHSLGIVLSVLGLVSDLIGKYMFKILMMINLRCLFTPGGA